MEIIGRKKALFSKKRKRGAFGLVVEEFVSRYAEWVLLFFFVGAISSCVIFSWSVSESSWSLDRFFQKNIVLPKEKLAISIEGAVENAGVFLVKKGFRIEKLIEMAQPTEDAILWKKLYKKGTIAEQRAFFIPKKEDLVSSVQKGEKRERNR